MLEEIGDISAVKEYINNKLENKEKIMGFGHRVYKDGDPRAARLREMAKYISEWKGDTRWYEMSLLIEKIVLEKKGLKPNVDFFTATVYTHLGIPRDLFTLIFAMSRTSGWLAHILEQHENNRLIRPRANYTGRRDMQWLPIADRH